MENNQMFFERNPIPMIVYDVDTLAILEINDAACSKYGYSREQFLERCIEDLRPEEEAPPAKEAEGLRRAADDDAIVIRHKSRNGETFSAKIKAQPICFGEHDARLVAISDVSQEVEARKEAEEAYSELDHLVKKNPLATIKWNSDLQVTEWTEQARRMSGYNRQEMIGRSMLELGLFSDEVRDHLKQQIEEFREKGAVDMVETQITTKSGKTVDIRIHTSVLRDASGSARSLLTLVEDITNMKEAERRLERQNQVIKFVNELSNTLEGYDEYEQALRCAIEEICSFVDWPLGHVYQMDGTGRFESTDIWFKQQPEKFGNFIKDTRQTSFAEGEGFLGNVLTHGSPLWLDQIDRRDNFIRDARNMGSNLKTCFAIPINVDRKSKVILEFLTDEDVELDPLFLEILEAIESQLGRILERIRVREELKISERKYRRLFERANDGIFIMKDYHFVDCNKQVQKMLNYSRKEIIGETPFRFSPKWQSGGELSANKAKRYIDKAREGEPQVFEWKHKTKDGERIDTEVSLNRIALQDGIYVQAIVRNITRQKEAERALQKSEELFRNLFLRAPVAMVMVDQDNRVVMVNRTFEQLFGFREKELLGRDIDKLIVPEGEYEVAPKMPNGEIYSSDSIKEYTRVTRDGEEIDVLVGAIPVYLEGEPLAGFGIYINISEQKDIQRKLTESLQEKEVLLKEIHHRVKNNLAVISAMLELQLIQDGKTDTGGVLEDSLLRIQTMALVHETLYKTENFANLHLESYISKLINYNLETTRFGQENIQLDIEVGDIDININQAIPCALIINELVSNALKYAFEGKSTGHLSVHISVEDENHVRLQVRDDGVGLPEEFDPHDSDTMGMTLVRQLTKQLDGELELTDDGGTSITITFQKEKKSGSSGNYFV